MKIFLKLLILFSIIVFIGSCSDPIFYTVFKETPVLKPLIDGSPTNFVEYTSKLYVASGKKIFSYSSDKWTEWNKLDDFVISLAATNTSLYTLYLNNNSGKIKRFYNNGNSSENLNLPYNVQSIHSAGNVLFISARNSDNNNNYDSYTIYYREEGNSVFNPIPGAASASVLKGVASDSTYYYLCTNSKIFYVEKTNINTSSDLPVLGQDLGFTGIINLNDNYAAAITNDGVLYEISNAAITQKASFDDSRNSTGALAIWYKDNIETFPSLLLVGRAEYQYTTSTGYSNGYVEITLDTATGRISGSTFSEPGKASPPSIDNYDRYVSSLGKKPINHIIQTPAGIPDSKMTLFASTQQDGVWSYRNRGDGMVWNAEQ